MSRYCVRSAAGAAAASATAATHSASGDIGDKGDFGDRPVPVVLSFLIVSSSTVMA